MIFKASKSCPVEALPDNNKKHVYYGEINISGLSHGKGCSVPIGETPEYFTSKQEGTFFYGKAAGLCKSFKKLKFDFSGKIVG